MRRASRTFLTASLLAVGLLAAGSAADAAGWTTIDLPLAGTDAWAFEPAAHVDPAPLVVFLHGAGYHPEGWKDDLEPVAEALGCVLLLPRAISTTGFGVGADDAAIDEGIAAVAQRISIDPARVALAGHSAGGAFAYVLAYGTRGRFSAVFTLGAPYRQVLAPVDPDYVPPIRLYYGKSDPNYTYLPVLTQVFDRLGIRSESEASTGYGHNTWPPTTLEDGFRFLLGERRSTPGGCAPTPWRLCLGGGRFEAEVRWRDHAGSEGAGQVADARSGESGLFWFFSPANWELQVKVLDGCGVNGRRWVYAAGTTDVEWELTVKDRASGFVRTYSNPLGRPSAAVTDADAFTACP